MIWSFDYERRVVQDTWVWDEVAYPAGILYYTRCDMQLPDPPFSHLCTGHPYGLVVYDGNALGWRSHVPQSYRLRGVVTFGWSVRRHATAASAFHYTTTNLNRYYTRIKAHYDEWRSNVAV